MTAFFPQPSPVLNIENLRDKYLGTEERITKLVLIDTEIELRERTRSLIKGKPLFLGAVWHRTGAARRTRDRATSGFRLSAPIRT
jgi:hypothetical protein